jgi:hypothetical protein
MAQISLEFDAQRSEDTPGDTRLQAQARGVGTPRNQEKNEKNGLAQRQCEAKQPEGA